MKSVPALTRLLDLEEIAAVFTFNSDLRIQAAAAPEHYTEPLLEQLILRIDQVLDLTRKARAGMKETLFVYEGHTIWVKAFGHEQYLALFIVPDADLSLLRQPINLALVNLDSASQRRAESDTSVGNTDLINAAHRAELELLQADRPEITDPRFMQLAVLAEFFLGPPGSEIMEYGLRDQKIDLPFTSKAQMVRVVDFASNLISNIEHKKMFLDECAELIERLEIGLSAQDGAEK